MPADDAFTDFMARLGGGDGAAAAAVFQRFTTRLIGLARIHMDSRVRQKVDPEDVLQSVYRSFFVRQARGEFDFNGWEGLWALLSAITVRKCARVTRRYRTGSRNVTAETAGMSDDGEERTWDVIDRGPTPSHAVQIAELVEQLMGWLPERERVVASLGLQGYSVAEIVQQTNTPTSTVYRILARIRDWLEQSDS